jgi:integrase/recombinase XerD
LEDLPGKVPNVSYRRDARIPSAFPKKDVRKILEAVDRGNPIGKRDYAILLLASKLGIRSGDIRNLKFSNIHWEKNTIQLTMSKTRKQITFPLLEDIVLAIIDYLKYGRPQSVSDIIFLRHIAPIHMLASSTMTCIAKRYINLAGIYAKPKQSQGLHALRHSLASTLLEDGAPLPVISEILGNTNSRTTGIYLKIDLKQLRKCALELPDYNWNNCTEVF